MTSSSRLTAYLAQAPRWQFVTYATLVAFCTYSCVFAFRKALPAAQFAGLTAWGIDYKTTLLIAQILGYMASKFLGIKVVSEMPPTQRARYIIGLILIAELAWLGFALAPMPYNVAFLWLNGFPLGMIWGLVFSYLEGRETTEILGTGLSASFIASSGFAKSVGKWVIDQGGFSEFWMPFLTGLIFLPPLVVSLILLNYLPPPSQADIDSRTLRRPMYGHERWAFFKRFAPGLILLMLVYMLLTAYRDFRDNFTINIWVELGYDKQPGIFTQTELPVSLMIFVSLALLIFIKNHRAALRTYHFVIAGGMLLVGLSTWVFQMGWISPVVWMIAVGVGGYLGYVPFNSILFDRMLAAFRYVGTAGFLIYLCDSFGYLASVGVMLYKNFGHAQISWLQFFVQGSYWMAGLGAVWMLGAWWYFGRQLAEKG